MDTLNTSPANPPGSPSANVHPLFRRLTEEFRLPALGPDSLAAFAADPGDTVLFFADDPVRVKESLDLAVILPEILQAFAGRLRAGVLLPAEANALAARYGIRRWPALVFVRGGEYVGSIEGLRDWDDYTRETARLLAAPTTRAPTIGIPVTSAR